MPVEAAVTRQAQCAVAHRHMLAVIAAVMAEDILDIRAVLDSREVPEPLATLA